MPRVSTPNTTSIYFQVRIEMLNSGKNRLCTSCLLGGKGKDVVCIGIQLCTTTKLHHWLKHKGNTKAKKLAGVGSNEVLRAVICAHSPANLRAGDRGATKGNTLLWFIEQRFSLTPGCILFGTNSTLDRNGTRQTHSTQDTPEILRCELFRHAQEWEK